MRCLGWTGAATMRDGFCDCCDVHLEACVNRRGVDAGVDRQGRSRLFPARYEGTCAGCGFDVRLGEQVRFLGGGQLVHEGCEHG